MIKNIHCYRKRYFNVFPFGIIALKIKKIKVTYTNIMYFYNSLDLNFVHSLLILLKKCIYINLSEYQMYFNF